MGKSDPGDDVTIFVIGAAVLVGVAYGLFVLLDLAHIFDSIR